ncbi:MAG: hypothetical protein ACRC17_00885 [Culicoidibacterales bacterium]
MEQTEIKKNSKKKMGMIIGGVIGVIIIAVIAASFLGGSNGDVAKYDASGNPVYLADNQVDLIYSEGSKHIGEFVELTGIVFSEPEKGEGYTGFQIWANPEKSEQNTMILAEGSLDVETRDYVKVTGYVQEIAEFENAFGGIITAPVIRATNVEVSTYQEIMSPTVKEVTFDDQMQDQHGFQFTVNKVEFAENETRVYVKAKNGTPNNFSLYTYSAVAVQGTTQYEMQTNYDADYPELPTDLQPGVEASGVLVFPAMEQTNFKVIIGGHSSDWELDIADFQLELPIN